MKVWLREREGCEEVARCHARCGEGEETSSRQRMRDENEKPKGVLESRKEKRAVVSA